MVSHIHNLTESCALCFGVSSLLFALAIVLAWTIWDLLSSASEHRATYRNISSQLSAIEDFYAHEERSY